MPTDVIGNTQSNNEGDGQMDIYKPAHGIFLRAHSEITQRDVAEDCKSQQTDQGYVYFDVQGMCLSEEVFKQSIP